MASAPAEQSDGLSVQLYPTTVRSRTMTFTEPVIWMWPWIVAPQPPTSVLLEPTVTLPEIVPEIWMTRDFVPPALLLRSVSVETFTAGPLPPPVVVDTPVPETEPHPTRGLDAPPSEQPPEGLASPEGGIASVEPPASGRAPPASDTCGGAATSGAAPPASAGKEPALPASTFPFGARVPSPGPTITAAASRVPWLGPGRAVDGLPASNAVSSAVAPVPPPQAAHAKPSAHRHAFIVPPRDERAMRRNADGRRFDHAKRPSSICLSLAQAQREKNPTESVAVPITVGTSKKPFDPKA